MLLLCTQAAKCIINNWAFGYSQVSCIGSTSDGQNICFIYVAFLNVKLHSKLQEDTDKARKEIAYVILKVKGYTSACMQILQINFRHIATNLNINNIPLFQNIKLLVIVIVMMMMIMNFTTRRTRKRKMKLSWKAQKSKMKIAC